MILKTALFYKYLELTDTKNVNFSECHHEGRKYSLEDINNIINDKLLSENSAGTIEVELNPVNTPSLAPKALVGNLIFNYVIESSQVTINKIVHQKFGINKDVYLKNNEA